MSSSDERDQTSLQAALKEGPELALLSLFATIAVWLGVPQLQTIPLLVLTFVVCTIAIFGLTWFMYFRHR